MKTTLSTFALTVILVISAIYFSSCSQDSPMSHNSNIYDTISIGGGGNCITLYAGQTINAGTVCFVDIDTDNDGNDDLLRVTYATTDGWELTEAHLFIGNSLADLPTTRSGNPVIGQFPYVSGNITGQTTYSFDIPFSALGISCPGGPYNKVFAAHSALRKSVNGTWQTETGWADGNRITTRGSWAEYNTFTLSCDQPVNNNGCFNTETSYAFGNQYAHCFSEYDSLINNDNRWGWSNGPLAPSTNAYTFDVYAGAGQCDLSKGTLAGTLSVLYNNGKATVTWNLNANHKGKEFHLYVGNEPLPRNKQNLYTLAPGQYPYVYTVSTGSGIQTYTFTVNNLTGNVYVVAHATVEDC